MRVLILLHLFAFSLSLAASETETVACDGPYQDQYLTEEILSRVLNPHSEWAYEYIGEEQQKLSPEEGFNQEVPDPKNDPDLRRANLCGSTVHLSYINGRLKDATLFGSSLASAVLIGPDLSGIILVYANLSNVSIASTNLSKANLNLADLTEAFIWESNLKEATLIKANLADTKIANSDLSGVNFQDANLSGAYLSGVNLSGARMFNADLTGVNYGPSLGQQPPVDDMATTKGLSTLTYDNPRALFKLRAQFKDAGYRIQERQITFAIQHVRTKKLLADERNWLNRLDGCFRYIFFELTTQWGLEPSRALLVILILIVVFSLLYASALRTPKVDGIWRYWINERVRADLGSNKPELLSANGPSILGWALYFSLLSAFNIGWRDLNVGNWIARLQPLEFSLCASGWVRTVSGVQSLISVYLLAIWALTYFGRPFG